MLFRSERAKKLEETHRILVNPTREKLEKFGLDVQLGKLLKEKKRAGEYSRPAMGFLYTESGDLIIGTQAKHREAHNLINDVFRDGLRQPLEYGVLTRDGVVINGPINVSQYKTLDKRAVADMSARMREISKALHEAGFAKDLRVTFKTPFEAQVWDEFLGPEDRKSTRLNSSHSQQSRMPSSA